MPEAEVCSEILLIFQLLAKPSKPDTLLLLCEAEVGQKGNKEKLYLDLVRIEKGPEVCFV